MLYDAAKGSPLGKALYENLKKKIGTAGVQTSKATGLLYTVWLLYTIY